MTTTLKISSLRWTTALVIFLLILLPLLTLLEFIIRNLYASSFLIALQVIIIVFVFYKLPKISWKLAEREVNVLLILLIWILAIGICGMNILKLLFYLSFVFTDDKDLFFI